MELTQLVTLQQQRYPQTVHEYRWLFGMHEPDQLDHGP